MRRRLCKLRTKTGTPSPWYGALSAQAERPEALSGLRAGAFPKQCQGRIRWVAS